MYSGVRLYVQNARRNDITIYDIYGFARMYIQTVGPM